MGRHALARLLEAVRSTRNLSSGSRARSSSPGCACSSVQGSGGSREPAYSRTPRPASSGRTSRRRTSRHRRPGAPRRGRLPPSRRAATPPPEHDRAGGHARTRRPAETSPASMAPSPGARARRPSGPSAARRSHRCSRPPAPSRHQRHDLGALVARAGALAEIDPLLDERLDPQPSRPASVANTTIPASATARSSSKATATPPSPTGPSACTMKVTSCRRPRPPESVAFLLLRRSFFVHHRTNAHPNGGSRLRSLGRHLLASRSVCCSRKGPSVVAKPVARWVRSLLTSAPPTTG
jgi:hypothetical protein